MDPQTFPRQRSDQQAEQAADAADAAGKWEQFAPPQPARTPLFTPMAEGEQHSTPGVTIEDAPRASNVVAQAKVDENQAWKHKTGMDKLDFPPEHPAA